VKDIYTKGSYLTLDSSLSTCVNPLSTTSLALSVEGVESGDIYPNTLQNGECFADVSKQKPSDRLESTEIIEPGFGEPARMEKIDIRELNRRFSPIIAD